MIYTKILSSTTDFIIDDNKKCSLSSKSAYYNVFWRITWHWKLQYWCWKFSFTLQG